MASLSTQQRKLPQALYSNRNRYFSVLEILYKSINYDRLQEKQMKKDFELHVMDVLLEQIGEIPHGQPLRVLGVGSNEGKKQQSDTKYQSTNQSIKE